MGKYMQFWKIFKSLSKIDSLNENHIMYCGGNNVCVSKIYGNNIVMPEEDKWKYNIVRFLCIKLYITWKWTMIS